MAIIRKDHGRYHTYLVDGRKLPGVTRITGMLPKDALINWAAEETARYAIDNWAELTECTVSERYTRLIKGRYAVTDLAKERGTEVHALAEQLIQGHEIDVPDPIAGHVDAYVAFLDQMDPKPIATELTVANRTIGYCGTLDLIADMDGERWLLDIKTSRSGIFRETALQVCAYMRAEVYVRGSGHFEASEFAVADLGITRGGGVHLRPDGSWDLFPLDTGEDVWACFCHLAAMFAAEDDAKGWVGPPAEPTRTYRTVKVEALP